MAEPALLAIAIKAEEISEGNIKQNVLRMVVALGVAVGIGLGSYRLVSGDPIHYYIIGGYMYWSSSLPTLPLSTLYLLPMILEVLPLPQ